MPKFILPSTSLSDTFFPISSFYKVYLRELTSIELLFFLCSHHSIYLHHCFSLPHFIGFQIYLRGLILLLNWTCIIWFFFQVMIDFQAAEKKRLEEPASDIGLEPLCAMVCRYSGSLSFWSYCLLNLFTLGVVFHYTLPRLTTICAAMTLHWS